MSHDTTKDRLKLEAQRFRLEAEAAFGLNEMASFFNGATSLKKVLEVGCGTGVLLSKLSQSNPAIKFTGLEPIGPGFTQFAEALELIKSEFENISFIHDRIEDLQTNEKFDLIFSVNVFEHLSDWRRATDICVSMLAPGGKLVVLCPNYSFPYESHFALPILGSKGLTYWAFKKRIDYLEEVFDARGLWGSLNFITSRQFIRHCRAMRFSVTFDNSIMKRMLDRLETDTEFRKRQSGLAKLAVLGNRLGAGTVLTKLPVGFSAYMKAVVEA